MRFDARTAENGASLSHSLILPPAVPESVWLLSPPTHFPAAMCRSHGIYWGRRQASGVLGHHPRRAPPLMHPCAARSPLYTDIMRSHVFIVWALLAALLASPVLGGGGNTNAPQR